MGVMKGSGNACCVRPLASLSIFFGAVYAKNKHNLSMLIACKHEHDISNGENNCVMLNMLHDADRAIWHSDLWLEHGAMMICMLLLCE